VKIVLYILLIFILITGLSFAGSKTKIIKPKNYGKKVTVIISGNKRTYYEVSNKNYTMLQVRGPGKLRILTRVVMQNNKDKVNYKLIYKLNGLDEQIVEFNNVNRSAKSSFKYNSYGYPGSRKDIELNLERGENNIQLRVLNSGLKVVARIIFEPRKVEKENWISFSPASSNEVVELITKEEISYYYRFSKEQPLKIEIIGSTELRVLTRFENNYKMKGRIDYRIQVVGDNNVLNTFLLSSKRSVVTYYRDNPELLPGKAREIYLKVDEGMHTFLIYPLDEDKGTLLGKVLFPEKDITNKTSISILDNY
jgi:hypothetical protein